METGVQVEAFLKRCVGFLLFWTWGNGCEFFSWKIEHPYQAYLLWGLLGCQQIWNLFLIQSILHQWILFMTNFLFKSAWSLSFFGLLRFFPCYPGNLGRLLFTSNIGKIESRALASLMLWEIEYALDWSKRTCFILLNSVQTIFFGPSERMILGGLGLVRFVVLVGLGLVGLVLVDL